ncbi:AI-2E family transporter [Kocuria flava]|uniref:AI-2E family transporter n=1 Tax=Kocuria flava TaxID=446860 RepID=UPI001C5F319C|nr:AI-2E family transporter [Kocuria flava]
MPSLSPWADGLGRAGSRAIQLLAVTAVAALVLRVLAAVEMVVLATVVALILASAVHPLVRRLEERGWGATAATVAVFVSLLGVLGGVVTGVVLGVRGELDELVRAAVTGWQHLQELVAAGPLPVPVDAGTVNDALSRLGDYLVSDSARQSALSGLGVASEVLTGTVLMAIVLFFFLKDGPRIWSFVLRWTAGETRARLAESGDRAVGILGSYVRGIVLIATIDATFIGLGLWALGVPLVVPLTVIVFLTAFVPVIGALVAGTVAALVALVAEGPVTALAVVLVVVVVNHLEGYFLQPVVMGRTLRLHGLVVLLALSAGSVLGGVAGAVLAVPLTAVAWAVLQVWTTRYQGGDDPLLGPDPVSSAEGAADRASRRHRWKYQGMRRQDRPAPWAVPPPRSPR